MGTRAMSGARIYSAAGFTISRAANPAALRWRLYSPIHGFGAADTLAGAYRLARRIKESGK